MAPSVNTALICLNHVIPHIRASSVVWLQSVIFFLPSYTNFMSSSAGQGSTQMEQSAADGQQCFWVQRGAAVWAALTTGACATSGTKKQLGSTHGVYSVVVFSHSSQTVAQIHVPDSPTQHDLLLEPRYFSTVNLGRKEQKLDAGTAHTRGTHLSLWSTVTEFSLGHSHWREWFCELPGFVNYLFMCI